MTGTPRPVETLGPALLSRLPAAVARPAYDRAEVAAGLAHIGVGAFHRMHQAEYTDDLLAAAGGDWGIVGINIRAPRLAETLGAQDGLYTRLIRQGASTEARVVGSILRVVDSQAGPQPALAALAAAEIGAVTLTVTEKGYCHHPATGQLDWQSPAILHDLAEPGEPVSLPGLVVRALDARRRTHGRPLTVISCDNIPMNGVILGNVVRALAERQAPRLSRWIEANAAFPSTMVDRIAPATSADDLAEVERAYGYRDRAAVVGEPFRQWVVERRFAGPMPGWDRVGALFVDDVTSFEHLKMRVLNAAQTTLACLGLLLGHTYTFEAVADPLLAAFVRRMLAEETLATLAPVPGIDPHAYVEQSLARLSNTAIRHRNYQIATDGSQKIVQRLLNPLGERLRHGQASAFLPVAAAASIAYLVLAAPRFGARWAADDPFAERIAAIADRAGGALPDLTAGVLGIEAIFDPRLAADAGVRVSIEQALAGLLSGNPRAYLETMMAKAAVPG